MNKGFTGLIGVTNTNGEHSFTLGDGNYTIVAYGGGLFGPFYGEMNFILQENCSSSVQLGLSINPLGPMKGLIYQYV